MKSKKYKIKESWSGKKAEKWSDEAKKNHVKNWVGWILFFKHGRDCVCNLIRTTQWNENDRLPIHKYHWSHQINCKCFLLYHTIHPSLQSQISIVFWVFFFIFSFFVSWYLKRANSSWSLFECFSVLFKSSFTFVIIWRILINFQQCSWILV